MRKFGLALGLVLALVVPSTANAAIANVFGNDPYGATNPAGGIPCAVQTGANAGIRLCTAATRSTAPSFDGVPIDLNMMFPPEAGSDTNWPMVMVFHGWAGSKSGLTAGTLRWINKGYAVLSITDRGFAQSCGNSAARTAGGAACNNGYIRLLDDRYEARDAQELAGMLVDQGVVDPDKIGAAGGSYGGGMSLQLAALNNRKMLTNGTLVPWTSPVNSTPMHVAAAVPEAPWSDLAYALNPNGSTLDYAANNPYYRPGVNRAGVQKQNWQSTLFLGGQLTGYYCGASGTPTAPTCPNPAADLIAWNNLANTGGPYDTGPNAALQTQELNEITTYHSGYYIDDSTAPSPVLISNGWNDDLFPVDENLRYYNKVRTDNPSAHIALWESDLGVHARGQSKAADVALLQARENDWMDYYVKGAGSQPPDGVDTLTTTCPSGAASAGPFHTGTWQAQSPGEVRFDSPGQKTIAATIASGAITTFNAASGGPCGTATSTDNASTANYRLDPASSPGYTIMGSPTVIADYDVSHVNDQVAVRLLDVNGSSESLIARGLWRPKVDNSPSRQVFQLHPQGYFVAPGHVVKLELLPHDSAYGRQNPSSPDDAAQHAITVGNLQLRLPVQESPGDVGGLVKAPADKVLPSGYSFAPGYAHVSPQTTVDSGPSGSTDDPSPSFGFSASESYASFECKLAGPGGPGSFQACDSDSSQAYSGLDDGDYTFSVRATTQGGTTDPTPATRTFTVDTTPPSTSIDSGPQGPTSDAGPTFTYSGNDGGGSGVDHFECRLDAEAFATCPDAGKSYANLDDGSHTFRVRAVDAAGNPDASPATRTFTVDTGAPTTQIDTGPQGPTNNAGPSFTYSGNDGGGTGVDHFECRLDAEAFATCPDAGKSYANLADGSHTFRVRAVDAAGNPDASPAARTFTVDTVAPNTAITSGPSSPTNNPGPSFTYSGNDGGGTGVDHFECRLDGASFATCPSAGKSYSGLADGSHTFRVRAVDSAGNPDASPATRTFTVDTAAPATTITSGPSGPTRNAKPKFAFSSSEAGSSFQCKVDSGAYQPCTSPKTLAKQADGSHTFYVRATDPAGNTDPSPAKRTFKVDTTPPETTITHGPPKVIHTTASTTKAKFTFESNEDPAHFRCSLDGGPFGSCTSPATVNVGPGSHAFRVVAVDAVGNVDPTPARRVWRVDRG